MRTESVSFAQIDIGHLGNDSRTTSTLRFALVAVPAASITFGLFLMMGQLIATDFESVEVSEPREIGTIIPEVKPDKLETKTIKPQPINVLDAPPPPPKLTILKKDVDRTVPKILSAVPTKIKFTKVQSPDIMPIAIDDRDATPLRPPIIPYPTVAQTRGIEGTCNVRMDVNVSGRPYNIKADCTDSVFVRAAERAIANVEFAPKVNRGERVERRNVVYPIIFSLKQ